jgi:hypothetical protein
MASAILRLARWVAWQLGELDRQPDCRPARITVISTGDQPASEEAIA